MYLLLLTFKESTLKHLINVWSGKVQLHLWNPIVLLACQQMDEARRYYVLYGMHVLRKFRTRLFTTPCSLNTYKELLQIVILCALVKFSSISCEMIWISTWSLSYQVHTSVQNGAWLLHLRLSASNVARLVSFTHRIPTLRISREPHEL